MPIGGETPEMTEMTDRDNSSAETDAETTSAESVDSPTTGDATAADDFTEVDSSDDDTVVLKKDAASSTSRTPQGKAGKRVRGTAVRASDSDDSDGADDDTVTAPVVGKKNARDRDAPTANDNKADPEKTETEKTEPRKTAGKKEFTLTITGRGLLRAAAVLVVVAVIAGAGFLGWKVYEQNQKLQAFDDSLAASKHFINELVGTMTTNTADQYKERLGPLSTGDFQKTLERERTDTEQQVRDIKVTSANADIKLATVEKFSADTATTMLQVEVTATGAAATTPQKMTIFYLITLEKHDGKWLVSDLGNAPGRSVLFGDGTEVTPNAPAPTPGAPNPTPGAPAPAPTPAPGG